MPNTANTQRSPGLLVIGALSGYPVAMLEPFARSLRATGFDGRFHVLAAGYDESAVREIGELADHVRVVDGDYDEPSALLCRVLRLARTQRGLRRAYPLLFATAARAAPAARSQRCWEGLEFHLEGLQSLRYAQYHRSIVEEEPDAEWIMISDLRDVVFQREPFDDPVADLEIYLEDPSEQVGAPGFNTRWMRNLYGQSFVDEHRGRVVSCCGTVVGRREAMLDYLSKMIAGIVWRRRPMGPHDQGVHNGLMLDDRLPLATIVPNGSGRVLTVGQVTDLKLDPGGRLVNDDGSIPAVIHQWDRHPRLTRELHALRNLS